MTTESGVDLAWLAALRRYFAVSVTANFAWEVVQIPLYTLWTTGTQDEIAFAVVHCTGGDALIATATLMLAMLAFGRGWPASNSAVRRVAAATIALGLAYTVYSEWLNVMVRKTWAYSAAMPTLPLVDTGLSPLAQWLVVPALALWYARPRPRRQPRAFTDR